MPKHIIDTKSNFKLVLDWMVSTKNLLKNLLSIAFSLNQKVCTHNQNFPLSLYSNLPVLEGTTLTQVVVKLLTMKKNKFYQNMEQHLFKCTQVD